MAVTFEDDTLSAELKGFLAGFPGGLEILELPQRLAGCRLEKRFEQLFVAHS
jgi:hypothetical protein